ncbi:phosphatidate cytidylyltransferase [Imbroritus primus]|uniref:Phosphatidate cytidylyltransferase n=1 Tax=Imbroritus primus TaxID=3058603 RepID=A0ACD3SS60_9BURK|nr:phosphatidate cytidylyltransferase [Burkholderiaceae bacterium PBA]
MLLTRVITALCLLLVILPVLFLGSVPVLGGLAAVFVFAAGWEWARLVRLSAPWTYVYGIAALVLMMIWSDLSVGRPLDGPLVAAAIAWAVALLMLRRGVHPLDKSGALLAGVLGLIMLPAFGLALMQLRAHGILMLLSVAVLVWTADIGAYFFGKAFGHRKLAPTVSPGKSWEGALGGWLCVMIIATAMVLTGWPGGTWPQRLVEHHGWLVAAALVTVLVAASVIGDLFESLLKRQAGMKDSSQLLPGHGGVLDRIDALLPAFPLALWLL